MTWEELKNFNFKELINILENKMSIEIEETVKTYEPLMSGSGLEKKIASSFKLNATMSSIIFKRALENLKLLCSLRDGLIIIESKLNDMSQRISILETMEKYR